MLYEVITARRLLAELGVRGAMQEERPSADLVITSYSIHYTKLYDGERKAGKQEIQVATGESARRIKRCLLKQGRQFVAQDVPNHAAEGAGNYAHERGNEKRTAGGQRVAGTGHAEQAKAKRIRNQQHDRRKTPRNGEKRKDRRHPKNRHGVIVSYNFV